MSAKKLAAMQPWLDAWATANNINDDFSTLADFPEDARSELVAAFKENMVPTKFKSKCGVVWCSNTQTTSYTRAHLFFFCSDQAAAGVLAAGANDSALRQASQGPQHQRRRV